MAECTTLILYGAHLHPRLLKQRFGDIKPISSQTVFIPNAYLSFDFKGIPFFEPCYSNAIVEYKNDLGGRVAAENEQESKNIIESEFYKRWLWTRCSPGLEYSRELPPVLEGVAYKFSAENYAKLITSDVSSPFEIVSVEAHSFSRGNEEIVNNIIIGSIPIVINPQYRLQVSVLPTLRYFRLVLLGSFFCMLSQPFIGHLVLLRSAADPPKRIISHKLKKFIYFLILLPGFLTIHLPQLLLSKLIGKLPLPSFAGDLGWKLCNLIETNLGLKEESEIELV